MYSVLHAHMGIKEWQFTKVEKVKIKSCGMHVNERTRVIGLSWSLSFFGGVKDVWHKMCTFYIVHCIVNIGHLETFAHWSFYQNVSVKFISMTMHIPVATTACRHHN